MRSLMRLAFSVLLVLLSTLVTASPYDDLPPLKNAEEVLREQLISVADIQDAAEGSDARLNHLKSRQAGSTWWFANIYRNGTIPFGNSSWVLYRNVKDYGAVGDGVTDDTAAMQAALDYPGNRCHGQYTYPDPCESITIRPAIIYIPPGTYIVKAPLIMYYNTMVMGDALNLPTIKAHPEFYGIALLDANPYYAGGANWYANQNNFWRQVRNLILDVRPMPYSWGGGALHWQVAQATNLQNIIFYMREGSCETNNQQGIFMDNGSGGFMRDLVFYGGGRGFLLGNQQFTSTNLTINNACTGVYVNWDWHWFFRDLKINNCKIGIDMPFRDKPAIGHVMVMDSVFTNVDFGVVTTYNCTGLTKPPSVGSLLLQNVDMRTVGVAVAYPDGRPILEGGIHVDYWMQGNAYSAYYGQETFPDYNNQTCWIPKAPGMCVQGSFEPPPIPEPLKKLGTDRIFDRGKPQYDDWPLSKFISAKANGCVGDGLADDTDCLINLLNRVTEDQILYIDHGGYRVTRPIQIPNYIKIVGEFWPLIFINNEKGFYSDMNNPIPAFKVGNPGDTGRIEMQDILFETRGAVPGAILMEWNLASETQGSAGMWDVHWRLGGTAGTMLQEMHEDDLTRRHCAKAPSILITKSNIDPTCYVSFLLLHITKTAELYMENNWGWVSDHELDQGPHGQINIWQGRGLLVESTKALWIIGGSFEHCTLYNYGIHNAKNVFLGHIQSETAYMQSNPDAVLPYPSRPDWNDPDFNACILTPQATNCVKTWGLRIWNSESVYVYGTGMYSFFQNYDATCLITNSCQQSVVEVLSSEKVYLFAIYSIGTEHLVMMDQTRLVPQAPNAMSFGSGVILFEFP